MRNFSAGPAIRPCPPTSERSSASMPPAPARSKNSKSPSPTMSTASASSKLLPQPKVRTEVEQEHYERVTARNLYLQERQGPVPEGIYGGRA